MHLFFLHFVVSTHGGLLGGGDGLGGGGNGDGGGGEGGGEGDGSHTALKPWEFTLALYSS